MSFLSLGYMLFFPLVLLLYFLLPGQLKNAWLLAASWFFCFCAGADCFSFLLCTSLLTCAGALGLERCAPGKKRPLLCALLLILFETLFLLKYLSFFFPLANRVLTAAGLASPPSPALELILPAGISFYLFAASGYLIDVYRGEQSAERSFLRCALFLSFFPHLIFGPIPRAGELLPQFGTPHKFDYGKFRAGLLRFLWGAFKKLCVADRLAIAVDTVFASPASAGSLQVIAAACAFSVQIYRVLHHCTVINIKGESYRLKERKEFVRQKQLIVNTLFQQGST